MTGLVARKTSDVNDVHLIPTDFISSQFRSVASDQGVDALKIGMNGISSSSPIDCIVSLVVEAQILILVLDPAFVTTHLSSDSLTILRE